MTTDSVRSGSHSHKQRDLLLALLAFAVALALWQVQGLFYLTYPLRLFVTMIHELGHGLAAILTGGSFLHFEVTQRGAGLAYTSGGSRFLIIQAGYVGTALFGAILLYLTNRVRQPGYVAIALGLMIGALALLYSDIGLGALSLLETALLAAALIAALYLLFTRETDQGRALGLAVGAGGLLLAVLLAGIENLLTLVVGLASGLLLIVIGWRGSRTLVLVTLNFLAFLTGLQAITDAWTLFKIVRLPASMMPFNDAASMADAYGGTAATWAVYWILLDVIIFGLALYITFIRPARRNTARES
ncbi:MAG: hypothetical protein GXY36_10400 [Chloroflexi bacterium]|nr:hypothetical protein [Chloroflexota bacterium]